MDRYNFYKAEKQSESFSDTNHTFTGKKKRKEMKKQKAEESASCPEWDSSTPQSMGAISEPLRATERESDTNFDELDLFLSKKKKPRNKNRLVKFDSIQTTPSLTTADFCEVQCNLTTNEETDGLHTYSEVSDFFCGN